MSRPTGVFYHNETTLVYQWSIPKFKKYRHEDVTLNSPKINTSNWEGFKCQLHMHLQLYTGLFGAAETIFIQDFCRAKLPVTVTCGIVNNYGRVVQIKTLTRMHTHNAFVKWDVLVDPLNELLRNDTLTIWCEFSVGIPDPISDIDEKNECKFLRLDEFDEFEALLYDEDFTDVTFKLGDKTIKAHKCILAKRSSVFTAMFQSPMKESQENVVVIHGIRHSVFFEMLRFIYSGKVRNLERIARNLLVVADRYLLENLKNLCGIQLSTELHPDNAAEILGIADKLNMVILKNKAIQFIVDNKKMIIDKPEFRELSYELIYEVYRAISDE